MIILSLILYTMVSSPLWMPENLHINLQVFYRSFLKVKQPQIKIIYFQHPTKQGCMSVPIISLCYITFQMCYLINQEKSPIYRMNYEVLNNQDVLEILQTDQFNIKTYSIFLTYRMMHKSLERAIMWSRSFLEYVPSY